MYITRIIAASHIRIRKNAKYMKNLKFAFKFVKQGKEVNFVGDAQTLIFERLKCKPIQVERRLRVYECTCRQDLGAVT